MTTLLQLLDEGILRDENNREISFRDTIVIATSNAGADRIREYIERGYQLQQFEQTFINELINANLFRPEFLNRFDEIVLFRPLGKEELLQVVDLILAGVNKTLAPQKFKLRSRKKVRNCWSRLATIQDWELARCVASSSELSRIPSPSKCWRELSRPVRPRLSPLIKFAKF